LYRRVPAAIQVWVWRVLLIKFLAALFLTVPFVVVSKGPTFANPAGAFPTVIAGLSLLGLVVTVAGVVRDLIAAAQLRSVARPVADARVMTIAHELAPALGLSALPDVRECRSLPTPMLLGAGRPVILLPQDFLAREGEVALRMVLAHEMGHLRRADRHWAWLATVARGVFFFHPLFWIALREMRTQEEAACDALAVTATASKHREYGELLIRLATHFGPPIESAVATGVCGPAEMLRRRVECLTASRTTPSPIASAVVALLAVAALPSFRTEVEFGPTTPVARLAVSPSVPVAGFSPAAAPFGRRAPAQSTTPLEGTP